jgi:hypothetical protein
MKKLIYVFMFCSLLSCNRTKNIDVPLPAFNSQPVVECYIEPGQPYRLTLTESVSYFSTPTLPVIPHALVLITHQGVTDTLRYLAIPDSSDGKAYNYVGDTTKKVPYDYNTPFTLYIKDSLGRVVTSTTTILPPVPIDTVEFQFNNAGRAITIVHFTDNPATTDYYRYLVVDNPGIFQEKGDIVFSDQYFQTSSQAIASQVTVAPGMIYVYLMHLTADYYNFLTSVNNAINANGNPFAQPASIQSNINGGIGIFTGLSYDVKYVLVQ